MNKQIGSVLILEHPDFKVKVGTFDKKNPSAIYFDGGIYISPLEKKSSYSEDLENIKNTSENQFKVILGNKIGNKYIFVEDIAEERLAPKKKTYLSFQMHIKPVLHEGKTFKDVSEDMKPSFLEFLNSFKETLQTCGFECSKTR